MFSDIQIAEHFKSGGDGGGEFRRKRRKRMEYAIYPQANSQAIVTGFNMNIRCALAQGLFQKAIYLFNDAGRGFNRRGEG